MNRIFSVMASAALILSSLAPAQGAVNSTAGSNVTAQHSSHSGGHHRHRHPRRNG